MYICVFMKYLLSMRYGGCETEKVESVGTGTRKTGQISRGAAIWRFKEAGLQAV